jgi:hypothetical protein
MNHVPLTPWAEIVAGAAHERIPPPARGQALWKLAFSAVAAVQDWFYGFAFQLPVSSACARSLVLPGT